MFNLPGFSPDEKGNRMASKPKAEPAAVDTYVGRRVRIRRRELGMSQAALAEQIGLTFQQVQKYERGTNRISASKLFEIAEAFQVPVGYFYDGLTSHDTRDIAAPGADWRGALDELLADPSGAALIQGFLAIKRGPIRRRLLDLVTALGEIDPPHGLPTHPSIRH